MRNTGWILLLVGLLLCATIAWAALGFLLMGIGLIVLQMPPRSRGPADPAVAVAAELGLPALEVGLQPPTIGPVAPREAAPSLQRRRLDRPANRGDASYDREAWRVLVASDPDLEQVVAVLADYGPQYVDELATSYLAAPDKSRLADVVEAIVARARGSQPPPLPTPPGPPPPVLRPGPQAVTASEDKRPDRLSRAPAKRTDDLEASVIAAFEEASAKAAARRVVSENRAETARPAAPTRREPALGSIPKGQSPPDNAPTGEPDASLIAALAEISGEKAPENPEPPKPASDAKEAASGPVDKSLTDLISKFAPDSNFLRKQ
ncbi:hypothetical protein [Bradyrhizobium lablabi]|uniref:hypothetical protein n=1 Tax=Bradyrhizobium lablabi TaxID=722472 RepID=UPI001BA7659B|nr:hypothetical protein [Bradyrhizobium lablabi]MBR0697346.1 hypothetical protein [Bradyrhizobium lablabi]